MDTANVLHEVNMTNEGRKGSRHQPHGTTKVHKVLLICLFLHSFFHSPAGLQANYSVLGLPHQTKQMVPASVKLPLPLVLWPPVRLRSGLSGTQPPSTKDAAHTAKLQVRVGRAQRATTDLGQPQLPARGQGSLRTGRRFRGAGLLRRKDSGEFWVPNSFTATIPLGQRFGDLIRSWRRCISRDLNSDSCPQWPRNRTHLSPSGSFWKGAYKMNSFLLVCLKIICVFI